MTFDTDDESMMASISRSETFPEGINVTLKSYGVDEDKKCIWINDEGEIISDKNLYVYVMQDHDEHFTAVYNHTDVKQTSANYYNIYSNRIEFTDDDSHTISIYNPNGHIVTSASVTNSYEFNLPSGAYILTIDGNRSTKIVVK